jgi:hypothetical protein
VSKPSLNTHIPQIQIQWPKLDSFTESVSTNGVTPRRPGPASPVKSSQADFKFEFESLFCCRSCKIDRK